MRQAAGETAGRGAGVARANHRHHRPIEQPELALGDQQRRGILDQRQRSRIKALPECQEARADALDHGNFPLGVRDGSDARRLSAPAPRKVGQGVERAPGRAEALDQLPIGDRSDRGGARKPEVIDEVGGQSLPLPILGSVPAINRRIFSR